MNTIFNIFNKILFYGFLLYGVIFFIFGVGSLSLMIFALGSFIFSLIYSYVARTKNIDERYDLYVNLVMWANLLGEKVFYYTDFLYYDKIIHFTCGLLISAIIYKGYSSRKKLKKELIFLSVVGILAVWEIAEYVIFEYSGYPLVGVLVKNVGVVMTPYTDTMLDLICGMFGSLIHLFLMKERNFERKVVREIKELEERR